MAMVAAAEKPASRKLIEDSEETNTPSGRPRKLARQSTDQVVKKALRDNFKAPEWTEADLVGNIVDGKNLVQKLTEIIHNWRQSDPNADVLTRGESTYTNLKAIYRNPNSPLSRIMAMVDPEASVTTAFVDALEATQERPPRHMEMKTHLVVRGPPSITELVGIARLAFRFNYVNEKHRVYCMDAVRFFQKHDVTKQFPAFWEQVQSWVHEVLSAVYVKGKPSKTKQWPETFFKMYGHLAYMCLPQRSVEK